MYIYKIFIFVLEYTHLNAHIIEIELSLILYPECISSLNKKQLYLILIFIDILIFSKTKVSQIMNSILHFKLIFYKKKSLLPRLHNFENTHIYFRQDCNKIATRSGKNAREN